MKESNQKGGPSIPSYPIFRSTESSPNRPWPAITRYLYLRNNTKMVIVNAGLYHYAGNNPVRYIDPDGREDVVSAFNYLITTRNSTYVRVDGGLPYEPEKWNTNKEVLLSTNCYAYALDLQNNPITGKPFPINRKPQPGNLADIKNREFDLIDYDLLIEHVKEDSKAAGFSFSQTTFNAKVKKGNWKVALVLSPGNDFHWYRLNENGTWSHKRGKTEVINYDASSQTIYNPERADRNYVDDNVNYILFIGFFEVGKCSSKD